MTTSTLAAAPEAAVNGAIELVNVAADAVTLKWADGSESLLPSIWLRDNCPSGFHAVTQERIFDLLSVPECPEIAGGSLGEDTLDLDWADGHKSQFVLAWLEAHKPGQGLHDPAAVAPVIWPKGMDETAVPRHSADAVLNDDDALLAWMKDTAAYGLSIIEGLRDDTQAGIEVAERIGFLRQTNFGTVFDVQSKPDPNNLAYTSVALPLHTDLSNQEVPPGYQFLHCLANDAQGGGSVFADGFAMAEDLRAEDPEAYEILSTEEIPFRFHDREYDIRIHSPVICLDGKKALKEIRFNAHLAAIFDLPAEKMQSFYGAYRAYMARTRDEAFRVTLRLKAGEMVIFDNRRALHGREEFDPSTGFRHLHGCYVDRGEFMSRIRVMARG